MLRTFALAVLGACLCFPNSLPDQITRKVEARYNGAHTLAVDFVENYEVQGRQRPPESGTLKLQKQGKMRWDYAKPAGKLLVSDGKSVYLYTAGDNRVEKVPVRDTEDMRAPLAFLLGHLDFKKEFGDIETGSAENGTWLDAAAKNDRLPYQKVRMLVEGDGSIQQLKVLGRDGSSMTFAFANEKLDPHLDSDIFRFRVPPGAEVVDAVEFKAEGK